MKLGVPGTFRLRVGMVDAAGIVGVLVAGGALYLGCIVPTLERTRTAESLRAELLDREGELRSARNDARHLETALDEARSRFAEGLVSLRPVSEANAMHGELTALASSHGLVIDEVTPGDARPVGRLMELPLQVSGRGSYVELARFLAAAHGGLEQMEVRGFSVLGNPAEPDRPLTFALELAWLADRSDRAGAAER